MEGVDEGGGTVHGRVTVTARQRWAAFGALLCLILAIASLAVGAVRHFPRGPLLVLGVLVAATLGVDALRRRGIARTVELLVAAVLAVTVLGAVLLTWSGPEVAIALLLIAAGAPLVRIGFRGRAELPPAPRLTHPVIVWNPRSGGGKAAAAHLDREATARGIESVELRPGDDLVDLVEAAVARGADALGAAGGDGTQALVATIAAREGLPFVCIPAGTRNHFALDLGVDRDDVVGALDAFVDGRERVVDLAEVNGRVFVNNASMGVYAEAVQHDAYRNAKVATLIDTVPDVLGKDAVGEVHVGGATTLRWDHPDGSHGADAAVLLVSNNSYRLGTMVGNGTRPTLDAGVLGVVAAETTATRGPALHLSRWETSDFRVDADRPVPIGVDGEALLMEPPLEFRMRPGSLRVLIAPGHPGASPSASAPIGPLAVPAALARIAIGRFEVPADRGAGAAPRRHGRGSG